MVVKKGEEIVFIFIINLSYLTFNIISNNKE